MSTDSTLTIKALLAQATVALTHHSDSPKLDAELMLAQAIDQGRTYLITWPDQKLTNQQTSYFDDMLKQRLDGMPIAYILGHKGFWSLDFTVTPDVLIPRPETELLVETALRIIPNHRTTPKVLELGTGSGCIAISLAHERPLWHITATDVSPKALAIAQQNAKQNHTTQIEFRLGSWYEVIEEQLFDAILSNPPYIDPSDRALDPSTDCEPRKALIAEDDGLADLKHIIKEGIDFLKPEGIMLLEHGYQQAKALSAYAKSLGLTAIETLQDLNGHDRLIMLQR